MVSTNYSPFKFTVLLLVVSNCLSCNKTEWLMENIPKIFTKKITYVDACNQKWLKGTQCDFEKSLEVIRKNFEDTTLLTTMKARIDKSLKAFKNYRTINSEDIGKCMNAQHEILEAMICDLCSINDKKPIIDDLPLFTESSLNQKKLSCEKFVNWTFLIEEILSDKKYIDMINHKRAPYFKFMPFRLPVRYHSNPYRWLTDFDKNRIEIILEDIIENADKWYILSNSRSLWLDDGDIPILEYKIEVLPDDFINRHKYDTINTTLTFP